MLRMLLMLVWRVILPIGRLLRIVLLLWRILLLLRGRVALLIPASGCAGTVGIPMLRGVRCLIARVTTCRRYCILVHLLMLLIMRTRTIPIRRIWRWRSCVARGRSARC